MRTEGLVIGQQGKGVFVREDLSGVEPRPAGDLASEVIALRTAVQDLSERLARVEATLSQRSES
ncbi:hypothetical protein Mro02_59670 [Microbispora rosea subsp. aerata]|nr:hypothetical protein Mro02_59670 [Microbispora rosea subsp. aerata]GLJ87371.1 hypothetical protein GCM10017588_61160 [Microbispora rosea subsp. aerata]